MNSSPDENDDSVLIREAEGQASEEKIPRMEALDDPDVEADNGSVSPGQEMALGSSNFTPTTNMPIDMHNPAILRNTFGDGYVIVKERNVNNCPGAIVGETVNQHTHTHVHVQSAALTSMKENTRSSIQNICERTFVVTRATERAAEVVRRRGLVMITGGARQGKRTMAFYLAGMLTEDKTSSFIPVELTTLDQWSHLLPDEKYVIIIDDLLGLNETTVDYQWSKVLKQILNKVMDGKVILIMTCLQSLFVQCTGDRIDSKVLDKHIQVNLCSDDLRLRTFEKVHILEKLLDMVHIKYRKQDLLDVCEEGPHHLFFECCDYFSQFSKRKKLDVSFFKYPFQLVMQKYQALLDQNRTLFFAMLKVAFDSSNIDEVPQHIGEQLEQTQLSVAPESQWSIFISKDSFQYRHRSFLGCSLLMLSRIDKNMLVKICPIEVLVRCTTIDHLSDNGKVFLDLDLYHDLADRMAEGLQTDMSLVLGHDCFSKDIFLRILLSRHQHTIRSLDLSSLMKTDAFSGQSEFVLLLLKECDGFREDIHELLREYLSTDNVAVCKARLDTSESILCCFLRLSGSGKMLSDVLRSDTDLDPMLGMNLDSMDKLIRELVHCPLECLGEVLSAIKAREDFSKLKRVFLCQAARFGQVAAVKLILETGDSLSSCDFLLPYAAEGGSLEIVEMFLIEDINPDTKSEDGLTPLQLACSWNHVAVAKRLVEAGADILATTPCGENLLHISSRMASGSRSAIVTWLLENYSEAIGLESEDKNGWTPLHISAYVGNKSTLQTLLENGAHHSSHDKLGDTPAHTHVRGENLDPAIIDLLHNRGADLHARNDEGETPLQVLVQNNRSNRCRVLKYLTSKTKESAWNDKGHIQDCLFSLVASGCNKEEAEILIEAGADVNAKNTEEETLLHLEQALRDPCLTRLLLAKGSDVLARDDQRQTPLHKAVCFPDNKTVMELLLKRKDPDNLQDRHGNTPLHIVCQTLTTGAMDYIQLLIQHYPMLVHVPNERGQTPLHFVAASGDPKAEKVAELLLDNGTYASSVDKARRSPLHLASSACQIPSCKIIKLLLKDGDIHCTDDNYDTPLHVACRSKGPLKAEVIDTLIEYGARPTYRNRDDLTVAELALSLGDIESAKSIIEALIKGACFFGNYKGHEVVEAWRLIPERNGGTLLHRVCEFSAKHSARLVREVLLYSGCHVNARDKSGKTPLHVTCEVAGEFSAEIVNELVAQGADVNCKDYTGHTALHMASAAQTDTAPKVVQILLKSKGRIDARDNDGNTPLHAAFTGNVIQGLINYGANIDCRNHIGLSPFDLFMQRPCRDNALTVLHSTQLWQICNVERELKQQEVEDFLGKGASLNHQHANGDTLLHKLSRQKGPHALENINLLLCLGADPHVKNNSNETPYEVAAFSENLEIAELLAVKEKTIKPSRSNADRKLDGAIATCDEVGEMYDRMGPSLMRGADAVERDSEELAWALRMVGRSTPIARDMVGVMKKMFETCKDFDK